MKRAIIIVGVVVFIITCVFATCPLPSVDINSAGPLTHIWIGTTLSCQVQHVLDAPNHEFYPQDLAPGDAGTFIVTGGTLYAPAFDPACSSAFFSLTFTPFTPVSQSGVTGTGTGGDPYTVVTVVTAGGITVTETDTYIVGNNFYSTEISLSGGSGILYRAGDAFMGGDDQGYGFTETLSGSRNAVGCSEHPNNTPAGKIEEWIPQTGGNHYVEDQFDTMWGDVNAQVNFPDTCQCTTLLDNSGGISWTFSGASTFHHDTVFIPSSSPTPTSTASSTATATATPTPPEHSYATIE